METKACGPRDPALLCDGGPVGADILANKEFCVGPNLAGSNYAVVMMPLMLQ